MFQASEGNTTTYVNKIAIDCSANQQEYNVTCTFENRANDRRNETLNIQVINGKFSNKHQCINKVNRAITALLPFNNVYK